MAFKILFLLRKICCTNLCLCVFSPMCLTEVHSTINYRNYFQTLKGHVTWIT